MKLSEKVRPRGAARVVAGVNGFGRFGLRLVRHWLTHRDQTNFEIRYINEIGLSAGEIAELIASDRVLGPSGFTATVDGKNSIRVSNGAVLHVSAGKGIEQIPWRGEPDIVFECTGQFTARKAAAQHLSGRTRRVIISATSLTADRTIILGVNEESFNPATDSIISYGSCTVNAYVPLANFLHREFLIRSSHVHVTHNTPIRDIDGQFGTIRLRPCTLQVSGVLLLPFLKDRFRVIYRLVPYPGVSLMDCVFELKKPVPKAIIESKLREAALGPLDLHLGFDDGDKEPSKFIGDPHSLVIIGSQLAVRKNELVLSGWFDNENSAARLFDLACFVLDREHQEATRETRLAGSRH